MVRHFIDAGHSVHVPWVAEREVGELERYLGAAHSRITLHRCDVTSEPAVVELFGTLGGRVDILANIVGGFAMAPIEETDFAHWNRMFQLNATATFLCTRAAVPGMKERSWGRIVNVASGPAVNHGAAKMSAYAASKAAVLNFTESLSKELVTAGITVNAIIPSVIDTPANRAGDPGADTSRWLKAEEIAQVVEFLCSDSAAIVNGSAVNLTRG